MATALLVFQGAKRSPLRILKTISWGVLPLVAGLFVRKRSDAGTLRLIVGV